MDKNTKLRVLKIKKYFPGVKALDNVSFSVKKGSIHAICGENGAGKSTLMKIINGIYQPDSGEIFIDENPVKINDSTKARNLGISMIFQELNFVPEMTVGENFFVGNWLVNKFKKINWKEIRRCSKELLQKENLYYDLDTKLKDLSVSDIQLLEIAKAISCNSDIIIMDEPTSAISGKEIDALFKKLIGLKNRGISIIYISHKMGEIFRIADEITILRDGCVVDTRLKDELDIETVISFMIRRKLNNEFPPKENIKRGKKMLEVKNLSSLGVFKDINFELYAGEIIGFAGLMGAGRTEVMRAIFGLDSFTSGIIEINEKPVKIKNVKDSINNGIVMLSEDRRRYGIIPVRSVRENVSLSNLKRFIYGGILHGEKEYSVVKDICVKMNVKTPTIDDTTVDALSGGNQQKIVLAKLMVSDPDILILDEPTRGIDVGAKYEIYKLMTSLTKEGKALLMVSSELPELLGMCDRIYIMSKGHITGELKRQDFSQELIMKMVTK